MLEIVIITTIAMQNQQPIIRIGNYSYYPSIIVGQGSTARVHLGFRNKQQTPVAVKVIPISEVNTAVKQNLLQAELQALTAVKGLSRHICQAHQILKDEHHYFIPMEYCSRGTLRSYIKSKGKLTETQALHLFHRILQGYSSLRSAGYIHRDIKSDNILLNEALEPVIIDFGYCQHQRTLCSQGEQYNVGSPAYMSPEAYNRSVYSEKSDVWALGVVLHEMVTGTIPRLDARDVDGHFRGLALRRGADVVAEGLSSGVLGLLTRCLAVDEVARVSCGELLGLVGGLAGHGWRGGNGKENVNNFQQHQQHQQKQQEHQQRGFKMHSTYHQPQQPRSWCNTPYLC